MKGITLVANNFFIKIFSYLIILILILISTSKIVFSTGLNKNINNLSIPEEVLAIKYCDAINKNIFNGLDKEESLKYEYYFSSLKNQYDLKSEVFFKNFSLNLMKNCSYKLTEIEKKEFMSYIKKFLNDIN